jgi:hypothetical protein
MLALSTVLRTSCSSYRTVQFSRQDGSPAWQMAQGKKSKFEFELRNRNSNSNFEIKIRIAKSVPPFQFVTGGSELYCSFEEVYKD